MRFPELVTQDGDIRAAILVLIATETSAEKRFHAIHAEVLGGNAQGADAFWRSRSRQAEAPARECGETLERLVVLVPEIKSTRRKAVVIRHLAALRARNLDHALGIRVGQRLEEHSVDHSEDSRVRADAERQR